MNTLLIMTCYIDKFNNGIWINNKILISEIHSSDNIRTPTVDTDNATKPFQNNNNILVLSLV